ncbi:MAG: phage tail sheath C-terminal domain-containing protein [Gammaproteobacteria bacterium]
MYKTPGVFIEEISTFPPSVVSVETAIPAFIGYTEKALDESLEFNPTRIRSLLEYQQLFGGDFVPDVYRVTLDTDHDNAVTAIMPRNISDTTARRYYMYSCLRHFYANGGGACYIVSVGSYSDDPATGETTTPSGLIGGLSRLERLDEPTMLLFPDGVSLSSETDLGSVQVAALAQCAKLQDRFTVMDLMNGDQAATILLNPIENFRNNSGTSNLKYGAAYYPWLNTIYKPTVNFAQLVFFNESAVAISDGDIDSLYGDIAEDDSLDALSVVARGANTNVQTAVSSVNISAMTGTDPLTLNHGNISQLMEHYSHLVNVLRETPPTPASDVKDALANLFVLPRAIALSFQVLEAATLGDEVDQMIADMAEDGSTAVVTTVGLIAYERNTSVRGTLPGTRSVENVESDYNSLDGTAWLSSSYATTVDVPTDNTHSYTGTMYERAMSISADLEGIMSRLATAYLSIFESSAYLASEAEKKLFTVHPVFVAVLEQTNKVMGLIPTSGAMAGIYATVDRTRGVWKAPANVSIADISGPAVKINDEIQGNLNVDSSGKSINAIRVFTGKGTILWGARTLDGNSNEWRYVSVRRFFNMAEESIKKASEPFTFEPNDANTWVRVRAMIENFLTIQWRNGALAGATTKQAYYVKIGLGETMTAQDILEGRMIIEIGMAVVRPAEFIILKFSHKMQVS